MTVNEAFAETKKMEKLPLFEKLFSEFENSDEFGRSVLNILRSYLSRYPEMAFVEISTYTSLAKTISALSFEAGRIYGSAKSEAEVLEKMFNSIQEK